MRHRGLGELDREQEPGGGFTIRGMFDAAAETLVIVSGAGLGKTTQLAELAGDLAEACLQELRTDPPPGRRLRPLPVPVATPRQLRTRPSTRTRPTAPSPSAQAWATTPPATS